MNGEKTVPFLYLFKVKSTTGEVPYKLLCDILNKLSFEMSKIGADCFECASNFQYVRRTYRLATRIKKTSSMSS